LLGDLARLGVLVGVSAAVGLGVNAVRPGGVLLAGATLATNGVTITPGLRGTFVCDPSMQPPTMGSVITGL
jgi:hypothetical protein